MVEQKTHIYLNPVRTDRAVDFERFLAETVVPALRAQRPELDGRWRVLRADDAEGDEGSITTYVFLFDGGRLEDWDLDGILPAHYGREEAERRTRDWLGTFAPRPQWAATLGAGDDDPQVGWTLSTVL